ncbi:MAG: hypothetical protein KDB79_11560 [Acidobacteria bacterium]|nr:hypothetical protein [Acidobacteriota bacterium]
MSSKISFLVLVVLLFGSLTVSSAQQGGRAGLKIVKEGVGFDGLRVGRSTRSDIIRKYGRDFRFLKNGKYSYQMKYKNGLSFYYCQSDKVQQIFDIEIRAPFKAKTSKGITLSKSTVSDVRRIYGKAKKGLRYRGVEFYYAEYRGKNVVSVIDIVESKGLRQCK